MIDSEEFVVLVDTQDTECGIEKKLPAHEKGLLHRAFSVYVFDEAHNLLLQRRASVKYHSGGLWTNTCCGHPRQGEPVEKAAHRRLQEEMGFDCNLSKIKELVYRAELGGGMTEHEYLHIFIGTYSGDMRPDPREVDEHAWVPLDTLETSMKANPATYTEWFKICFPLIKPLLAK